MGEHKAETEDREDDDSVHLHPLEPGERHGDIEEAVHAVREPLGDGHEETALVVGCGRVERDPQGGECRRHGEGEPERERRRQRRCEREREHPPAIEPRRLRVFEPQP